MAKKKRSKKKSFLQRLGKTKKKKLGTLVRKNKKKRIDPLWTLDQGISYSMITKFMNCRQRFHLATVQGWKPKGINLPLEYGNMFHLMVEAQDAGVPMEQMTTICLNYVRSRLTDPNIDEHKAKDLSMIAAVCAVTFVEYVKYWQEHYSIEIKKGTTTVDVMEDEFEWLGKETAFDFIYQLPDGTKVKLVGKRDGEFRIRKLANMGIWLFETKTKGDIDEYGITKGLQKDMQTMMYMTALEHKNRQIPAGVVYNCIRRTRLKPRVADTPVTFAERVKEDIQKRPDFYFYRWTRLINERELTDFKRTTLNPILFQIVQWWNSIKANPMNPFETPCKECDSDAKACIYCDATGVVANPYHLERPFGCYDGFQHSQRGEFFEIVTDNNYNPFEVKEHAFPELQEDDSYKHYLEAPF